MLPLLVCLAVALNLVLIWHYSWFYRKGVPMPSLPCPILGHVWPTLLGCRSLHDLMADLYQGLGGHGYGGIFAMFKPVVVVTDPQLIGLVTVSNFDHFTDHQHIGSSRVDPILANSLMFLPGELSN